MTMMNVYDYAAVLYDGGWRAEDYDQLMAEYDLTIDETDAICRELSSLAARYTAQGGYDNDDD